MNNLKSRTTIEWKTDTKPRLDKNRAPGQCYGGFLCHMVELWEITHNGRINKSTASRTSD